MLVEYLYQFQTIVILRVIIDITYKFWPTWTHLYQFKKFQTSFGHFKKVQHTFLQLWCRSDLVDNRIDFVPDTCPLNIDVHRPHPDNPGIHHKFSSLEYNVQDFWNIPMILEGKYCSSCHIDPHPNRPRSQWCHYICWPCWCTQGPEIKEFYIISGTSWVENRLSYPVMYVRSAIVWFYDYLA